MFRVALVAAAIVLIVTAIGVLVWLWLAQPQPPAPPDPGATDAEWARFYRKLAEHARRTGNHDSARNYESIAATYETFRTDGPPV